MQHVPGHLVDASCRVLIIPNAILAHTCCSSGLVYDHGLDNDIFESVAFTVRYDVSHTHHVSNLPPRAVVGYIKLTKTVCP